MVADPAEFNTIITMLGMMCATVQGITGYYAAYYKKRMSLLRTNDSLFRAHRAFGSSATTLYFLGLFNGITGFVGAVTESQPPLELQNPMFNIHTWGSFAVLVIILMKTYFSYFNKGYLYRRIKGKLGVAAFSGWAFTWLTSASAYYERTLPTNPQHPPPTYLLPIELFWIQLAIPFLVGSVFGILVWRRAHKAEELKAAEKKESAT